MMREYNNARENPGPYIIVINTINPEIYQK